MAKTDGEKAPTPKAEKIKTEQTTIPVKVKKKNKLPWILVGGCCVLPIILVIIVMIIGVVANNVTDKATEYKKTPESNAEDIERKAKLKAEDEEKAKVNLANLRANAETIPYKTLYRDITNNKGKQVHYKGKVIQISTFSSEDDKYSTGQMRVNITQDEYGYWSDTVMVLDTIVSQHPKLLEDDIIEFWGTVYGETSYTSVLGATISLPNIDASIVELVE